MRMYTIVDIHGEKTIYHGFNKDFHNNFQYAVLTWGEDGINVYAVDSNGIPSDLLKMFKDEQRSEVILGVFTKSKTFTVPVTWYMSGTYEVTANNLDEAIEKVLGGADLCSKLPKGDYIDDSMEVNMDLVRELNPSSWFPKDE